MEGKGGAECGIGQELGPTLSIGRPACTTRAASPVPALTSGTPEHHNLFAACTCFRLRTRTAHAWPPLLCSFESVALPAAGDVKGMVNVFYPSFAARATISLCQPLFFLLGKKNARLKQLKRERADLGLRSNTERAVRSQACDAAACHSVSIPLLLT